MTLSMVKPLADISFRAFCTSAAYCGLTLSPLGGAIVDASEGRPVRLDSVADHFGCTADELPRDPRRTIVIRAGGRGGKTSRLIAPAALHAAWTVPLPTLQRGEVASSAICAPDTRLARQALSFVRGYVQGSPVLSAALVEETKDHVTLRRPDGHLVRVEVLPATRGARATRGRTYVFFGMDEASFFFDEDTGIVCDAEVYRGALQRVVPQGQVWIASTAWITGVGLLESLFAKNFGTHTHALTVQAGTRQLNPTWDPTGEIERDLRSQDPDAAAREIDAVPLPAGSGCWFAPEAIEACVEKGRPLSVEAPKGARVHVGADLAFTKDSSALCAVAASSDHTFTVVHLEECRPKKGAPLRPKDVIDAFALTTKQYGATGFTADAHYKESAREHLAPHGLAFDDAPGGQGGKVEVYLEARKLIHEGRVRLPDYPRLLSQLRSVMSRPTPGGGVVISSPRRPGGGHGDLVSALVLALFRASRNPAPLVQGGSFTTLDLDHQPTGFVDARYQHSASDDAATRTAQDFQAWIASGLC